MGEVSLNRAVRHAKRIRSLGPDARCGVCGADNPVALQKRKGGILCYECAAAKRGKTTVEQHHLLGRANADVTIGLPANLHREVSDRRYDCPERIRKNPDRDPLLWTADVCHAVLDLLRVLAEWLERIVDWLIRASEAFEDVLGPRWWDALGIGTPWGEAAA